MSDLEETAGASGELALEKAPARPFTTAEVNDMLWRKYTDRGQYVVLFDVPDVVGLQQQRRCDAVAIGMWQSSSRLIHGFEVKVSRSDWLREVRSVDKADPFLAQCDRWWLVTGSADIAKPEEIPDAWGWMSATKTGLRIQRPAKPLPQDQINIRRLWAFALIRRAAERDRNEIDHALEANRRALEEMAERRIKAAQERAEPELASLRKQVADFEAASGMKLTDWRLGNVGRLARKLHRIGDYQTFATVLDRQAKELDRLAREIREAQEACASPALEDDDKDD